MSEKSLEHVLGVRLQGRLRSRRQRRELAAATLIGLGLAFAPAPTGAQENASAARDPKRLSQNWQLSLNFENDVFYGQDSGYSTGLRLVGSRNEDLDPVADVAEAKSPADLRFLRSIFPDALDARFVSSTSRGLGFSIFTPQDNDAPDDERPYGGYVYGLFNVQRFFSDPTIGSRRSDDRPDFTLSTEHYEDIEVQLGWLGPHSGMEQLITGFHEIWPRGGSTEDWPGREIEDSPAVNLYYTRVWSGFPFPRFREAARNSADAENAARLRTRATGPSPAEPREADAPQRAVETLAERKLVQVENREGQRQYKDIRPFAGVAVGNVYDYVSTGATARLGWNIPTTTIGPPLIRPGPPGSDRFEPQPGVALYGFVGLEGRFVLYDAFLDGNTRDDSPNVDKKYFIGDFQYGAALEWRFLRLAYNRVMRSALYDGQGTTSFGSVNGTVVMPF